MSLGWVCAGPPPQLRGGSNLQRGESELLRGGNDLQKGKSGFLRGGSSLWRGVRRYQQVVRWR